MFGNARLFCFPAFNHAAQEKISLVLVNSMKRPGRWTFIYSIYRYHPGTAQVLYLPRTRRVESSLEGGNSIR